MQGRPNSFRFICVYREEARTIAGVSETWRGWVQMVPPPMGAANPDHPALTRRWFRSLDELPAVVCELMAEC